MRCRALISKIDNWYFTYSYSCIVILDFRGLYELCTNWILEKKIGCSTKWFNKKGRVTDRCLKLQHLACLAMYLRKESGRWNKIGSHLCLIFCLVSFVPPVNNVSALIIFDSEPAVLSITFFIFLYFVKIFFLSVFLITSKILIYD